MKKPRSSTKRLKTPKHSSAASLKVAKNVETSLPFNRGFTLGNSAGVLDSGLNTRTISGNRRLTRKQIIKRILLAILIIAIVIGGWIGWKFYQNIAKLTGDKNPLSLFSLLHPAPLQEVNGRVNILLAGNSTDDPGHSGAALTDSILIISYDPKAKTAYELSIPRDMWVDIPGFGYSKINAAYEDGGMQLLSQVIQQDFGIQTPYTALLDYTAFRDAVNAVGGITIDINSPDPRGLYDPNTNLKLPNGEVSLNGQTALNLARARGDGPGSYGFPQADFDRTQHQRQMLIAIKDKAGGAGTLLNPIKVVELSNAVGNNVQTNLTVGQLSTLYDVSKSISDNNITSLSLNDLNGQDLVTSYYVDGQDALIPRTGINNYSQIQSDLQPYTNSSSTN